MRKLITAIMIVVFISTIVFIPSETEAKTLRQAYADLSILKAEANEKENKQKLTEQEITQTKAEITKIYEEIKTTNIEVEQLEKEIKELNESINLKESEIKDLSKYLQVSTGESAYLEYAFGSETITEFVYRMAVIEQLNEHNSNLVIEMEEDINTNNQNKSELKEKLKKLDKNEKSYVEKLKLLGKEQEQLEEAYSDIKTDIEEAKILLDYYEKSGCKLDQELEDCVGKLPYNTTFKRPSSRGYVTSNYGIRIHPVSGYRSFHYGIDIGIAEGSNLYPIANGIVTSKSWASCGGWRLYIIYNIDGEFYTTAYLHLSKILVDVGDVVSVDEVVAKSGGRTGTGDVCTTGSHLHFAITKDARYVTAGLYGIPAENTYTSYDLYIANMFNPRSSFDFGYVGAAYYSRGQFTDIISY